MRNEFDDQNGLIAKVDPYDRPADRAGLWIGPSVIPMMPPRGGLMLGSRKGRECFYQVARRSWRASGTRHAAAFLTVPGGVPKLLLARQGEDDMQVSNTIDCNGLSPAPTLLRIMQALGIEDRVEMLLPDASLSPLDPRSEDGLRQRARPPSAHEPAEEPWSWGE